MCSLLDEATGKVLFLIPMWKRTVQVVKCSPYNIRMSQMMLMHSIKNCTVCTMSELAKREQISAQQLTRSIDELVNKNYVFRYINPNNRRETLVELTEEGKQVLDHVDQDVFRSMKTAFSQFSDQQLQQLIQAFDLLLEVMEQRKETL
ncbi:MAG: MarR family transcriptional regulator [Erysipelotrichaceae bacterium]|nr:MarR family transcriptional regulator [Erysipelotrichaceae bacterium]